MLNKIFALGAVLASLSISGVEAETLIHTMNCKVQSNVVVRFEDGKSKTFSGYAGQFDVGDTLTFKIEFVADTRVAIFSLKGDDGQGYLNFNDLPVFLEKVSEDPPAWQILKRDQKAGAIRPDIITLVAYTQNAWFKRYYKNDWQGLISETQPEHAQIFTVDCRMVSDMLDEIFAVPAE